MCLKLLFLDDCLIFSSDSILDMKKKKNYHNQHISSENLASFPWNQIVMKQNLLYKILK